MASIAYRQLFEAVHSADSILTWKMRTKCVWLKYVYITQQRRKTYQKDISRQFEICTEICNVNTIKTSQDKKADIRKKKKKKKKSKNTSKEAMSL